MKSFQKVWNVVESYAKLESRDLAIVRFKGAQMNPVSTTILSLLPAAQMILLVTIFLQVVEAYYREDKQCLFRESLLRTELLFLHAKQT